MNESFLFTWTSLCNCPDARPRENERITLGEDSFKNERIVNERYITRLHPQVDWSIAVTDTGGFVSLSMVANKAFVLLLFLGMMSV